MYEKRKNTVQISYSFADKCSLVKLLALNACFQSDLKILKVSLFFRLKGLHYHSISHTFDELFFSNVKPKDERFDGYLRDILLVRVCLFLIKLSAHDCLASSML